MEEKPPTKSEFSAKADDVPDELEARLRQLAEDYTAAFHRNPTEEGWRTARLLYAIGESPRLRHALHVKPLSLIAKPEALKPAWKRWVWVNAIRASVAGHKGDPEAVAQSLIVWMPGSLRAKYPDYPTNEADLEKEVSKVLAARNFKRQVAEWHTGEQDVLKLARAVLRGLGMSKDDAKDLLRRDQWEAWLREHGEP